MSVKILTFYYRLEVVLSIASVQAQPDPAMSAHLQRLP